MSKDKLHLLHIRDAATKIKGYLSKITHEQFKRKEVDFDAVLMQMMVIGQAANDLSEEFREEHPNLPWFEMVGLRNRVAHGYLDIDSEIIWETANRDLPKLKEIVLEILREY